ncbi:hypothetical protein MUN82_12840 [Hymenobacter aerilatus]|uniref:CBM-cenC domain-containing protein n=1 Tax=Hymenobacter aerilatus TaxID=2932251 RepID=A0A8T9SSX5_9BACT|nr:hypothetical protein [Hymenobacter aerilatus]UOR03833.1 hypothetical protein MUN82_12840 [Hymenobacter aerilatus]
MRIITVLVSLLFLAACSSEDKVSRIPDDKIITQNDFESAAGWNIDPDILYHGNAHSGHYAIKVDKDHEFSLTFDTKMGIVSPTRIKTVHLEAWAFLPSDKSTGILGLQIMDPATNTQVYSRGIRLAEKVKSHSKWEKVEADYDLPANITSEQHIRLSLWRADAIDQVLVDDVKLSIKE